MTTPLEVALANLSATEEALLDATDRLEEARRLCRMQVVKWRTEGRGWAWIGDQPCAKAFNGPLMGS